MNKLVQFVYISRSNLPSMARNDIIQPEVSQILSKSRRNNRSRQIVGALYYGNGYFFQCLEGEEKNILELYEVLKTDNRHSDLHIVSIKPITQRSFGDWEMKYVPAERDIQKLLGSFGMKSFDPYRFDESMSQQMLQLLLNGSNLSDAADTFDNIEPAIRSGCRTWKFATLVLSTLLIIDLGRHFL